jgi:hypothetical protein
VGYSKIFILSFMCYGRAISALSSYPSVLTAIVTTVGQIVDHANKLCRVLALRVCSALSLSLIIMCYVNVNALVRDRSC